MDKENSLRIFPVFMKRHIQCPPNEARAEEVEVYRICKTGCIEQASFLPSYLEYEKNGCLDRLDLNDVGSYSLSCFAKARDARNKLIFFTKKEPRAIAAKGITSADCGVIQRTRERKKTRDSHIDWWLYENAEPWKYFKEENVLQR